ncbi:hypothetical protein TIFTF001_031901 [Ficus carica]|uniref:Uncharacterized protein n=1 Tax=Ficus carica TaxID=3494 RepID=A0AA88J615_FICCA|nr:hypothetical protein TIFTF001_031901 [Ficus carica]
MSNVSSSTLQDAYGIYVNMSGTQLRHIFLDFPSKLFIFIPSVEQVGSVSAMVVFAESRKSRAVIRLPFGVKSFFLEQVDINFMSSSRSSRSQGSKTGQYFSEMEHFSPVDEKKLHCLRLELIPAHSNATVSLQCCVQTLPSVAWSFLACSLIMQWIRPPLTTIFPSQYFLMV